jgi:endogenous inhibitor of DNA gyrase (YacG/DUF329 family)
MDKQKLIDLFFRNGVYHSGTWRNAALVPEVNNLSGDTLSEKVWNGLYTRKMCHCGKPTRWLNFQSGYRQYCSAKCIQANPFNETLKRERQESLWSDPDWKSSTSDKMKETHFKKRTPKKLNALAERGITPLDDITPGQQNEYRWRHTCGQVFVKSFARIKSIYCPKCHVSRGQGELYELIRKNYSGVIIVNDRIAIAPKEIDIYLPDLKLGFEFNGKYWHEGNGSRERFKTTEADAAGIRIVHIWETEWKKDRSLQEASVLTLLSSS